MNALAQDENGVVDFEESADAFAKYMMLKEGNPMFLTTLQSVQLVILVKGIIETPNAKTYSGSSVDPAKDPKKGISAASKMSSSSNSSAVAMIRQSFC